MRFHDDFPFSTQHNSFDALLEFLSFKIKLLDVILVWVHSQKLYETVLNKNRFSDIYITCAQKNQFDKHNMLLVEQSIISING